MIISFFPTIIIIVQIRRGRRSLLGFLELQSGLDDEVIVGVLLVREEGTVVVHGFADIFYLARVTAVVVYFEIGANLVNALLGQLIHLSSLHL